MSLKMGKRDTSGTDGAVKNKTDGQQMPPAEQLPDDKKTEELILKLQEAEKRAAENYDKYLRSAAEFDNYRKRAIREKADAINYGNEKLLQDILPLLDGMDRALEQAGKAGDFEAFQKGLQMIRGQFAGFLKKQGVESMDTLQKDFDPNLHEALLQVDSADHEHNKVVSEFEKGFLLNGRLLRPAKVSVCRRPAAGDDIKNECENA